MASRKRARSPRAAVSAPSSTATRGWIGAALLTMQAGLAQAQEPAQEEDAAADRAQAFRAVEGAIEEDVPGGPLLVGAYGVVVTLLVLYVLHIARLQRRVGGDIARLERALEQAPDDRADG